MAFPYFLVCAASIAIVLHAVTSESLPSGKPGVYLCAIAKEEDLYIEEWVTYHLLIGIEQIHIYDNNDYDVNPGSGNITISLAAKHPDKVFVHPYPGHMPRPLISAFMEFAHDHRDDDVFAAFLDVDEFLVLGPHKCVHDMLREYAYVGRKSLGLNWMFFGNNGHTEYENRSVAERFTTRRPQGNPLVKTVAYCPHIADFNNAHHVRLKERRQVYDLAGNIVKNGHATFTNLTEVAIHHFAVKSLAEFKRKMKRGSGSPVVVRNMAYFNNLNTTSHVFDDRVMRTMLSYTPETCSTGPPSNNKTTV
jgi:hypothetical protein